MLHIILAFFHLFPLSIFYSQCLSDCISQSDIALLYTLTAYYKKTRSFRCQSINVNNNSSNTYNNTPSTSQSESYRVFSCNFFNSTWNIILNDNTVYNITLYRITLLTWIIVTKGRFTKDNFSAFAQWHL